MGYQGKVELTQLVKQRFIEDLEEGKGVRAGGNDVSCANKYKQETCRAEGG